MRQFENIRNASGSAAGLAAVAGIVKGTGIGGTSIQSLVSHLPLGWWGIGAIFLGGIIVGSCAQSDTKTSSKKQKMAQLFKRDLNAIQHKEYCETLAGGGTSKLLEFYRRLTTDFDQMRKACGFGVVVEEC
ncbi:hypothetical protein TGAM01_v203490 [Trichoderma gamsii]|uniref:Uncharacterized protein n=1 Tax=Trichoderma gamsii TaxID=398673 RepID=A0A2P4ZTZ0_9HYPO|nr:hypothetical protein TGAM01_v203490 [Trichoderma gamsii]PON27723.1 hypothetical protein TGAM01_v203490 [Trichoderma gamsii]